MSWRVTWTGRLVGECEIIIPDEIGKDVVDDLVSALIWERDKATATWTKDEAGAVMERKPVRVVHDWWSDDVWVDDDKLLADYVAPTLKQFSQSFQLMMDAEALGVQPLFHPRVRRATREVGP